VHLLYPTVKTQYQWLGHKTLRKGIKSQAERGIVISAPMHKDAIFGELDVKSHHVGATPFVTGTH
jgi:hypothetical protein